MCLTSSAPRRNHLFPFKWLFKLLKAIQLTWTTKLWSVREQMISRLQWIVAVKVQMFHLCLRSERLCRYHSKTPWRVALWLLLLVTLPLKTVPTRTNPPTGRHHASNVKWRCAIRLFRAQCARLTKKKISSEPLKVMSKSLMKRAVRSWASATRRPLCPINGSYTVRWICQPAHSVSLSSKAQRINTPIKWAPTKWRTMWRIRSNK